MRRRWTIILGVTAATVVLVLPATAIANRNLYAAGFDSDTISASDIAADGSLTAVPGSPFSTGVGAPEGTTLTPNGANLYVSNFGADQVLAFNVGADGALAPVSGSPFAVGADPIGIAATPDGSRLYVANAGSGSVSGFAIDASGALTPISTTPVGGGTSPWGLAVSPNGRFLFVARHAANSIHALEIASDGTLSAVAGSPFGTGAAPEGVAITPDGRRLYVTNHEADSVSGFEVSESGALSPAPGSPFPSAEDAIGLAISPDGSRLFVSNQGASANNVSRFEIAADGSLNSLGAPVAAATAATGIALSPDGGRLYVGGFGGASNLFGFDVGPAGELSPLPGSPYATGAIGNDLNSLAFTPNQGPLASFTSAASGPRRQRSGGTGSLVRFDARASSDADGSPARFDWGFGDGSSAADGGATPMHNYSAPGVYTVTLTVTDNEGCSATLVYTGQTASCNGTPAARAQQQVTVPDTDPPVLKASGKRQQDLGKTIVVKVRADEPCTVTGSGRLVVASRQSKSGRLVVRARSKTFRLGKRTRELSGKPKKLKLRVPEKARKAAARALAGGGSATARIKLIGVDDAGNKAKVKRRVRLK